MFSFAIFGQNWLGQAIRAVAFALLAVLFLAVAGTVSMFSFIAWLFQAPWLWVLGGLVLAAVFFGSMLWSAWLAVCEIDGPKEA